MWEHLADAWKTVLETNATRQQAFCCITHYKVDSIPFARFRHALFIVMKRRRFPYFEIAEIAATVLSVGRETKVRTLLTIRIWKEKNSYPNREKFFICSMKKRYRNVIVHDKKCCIKVFCFENQLLTVCSSSDRF